MKEEIRVIAKECIQQEETQSRLFAFAVPAVCFFLAVCGIAGSFLTAFSIPCNAIIFYSFLLLICLFWIGFSKIKAEGIYRLLAVLVVLIGYGMCLLVLQNSVISGCLAVVNRVVQCINETYEGNLVLYQVSENPVAEMMFLLFVLFLISGFLSMGFLYHPNVWILLAMMFPITAGIFLAGGKAHPAFLFLMFLTVAGVMAASNLKIPMLMGEQISGEQREKRNQNSRNMRGRMFLAGIFAVLPLAAVAFLCMRPAIKPPVEQVREFGMKNENGVLQALQEILPRISGGRLSLKVEGSGGGVDEGILGETKGFYFGDTQALQVICSKQPEETLYLKGYIGATYTGDSFDALSEERFLDAAVNWHTEGKPGLYIENLPFLRMMYMENVSFDEEDEDARPQLNGEIRSSALQIQVKNLNANPSYSYLPYYAYLNDYYEVQAGDGAVSGQTMAEDIFSYYPRAVYEQEMETWAEQEDYHGVLDQVEASYEAFVYNNYLQLPEDTFAEQIEKCQALELEDPEEISAYIVETLIENYTFNIDTEPLPEGKDFVTWFMEEEKQGYSTHFAAAATMMFRMFGIPSRYVVGYVATKDIFTMQADGSYMAVLEDDNAHAWTEIYLSGIGWVPVETTPGFVGVLDSGSFGPQQTEAEKLSGQESSEEKDTVEESVEEESRERNTGFWILTGILTGVILIFLMLRIHRNYMVRKRLGKITRLDRTENIKQVYRSFYELLLFDGWQDPPGCSTEDFPQQIAERYEVLTVEQLEKIAEIVLMTHYGNRKPEDGELIFLRECYLVLGKAVYQRISRKKRFLFKVWKCYL